MYNPKSLVEIFISVGKDLLLLKKVVPALALKYVLIRIFLSIITNFVQKPKEKPLLYLLIPSGRSQEQNGQI